MCLNVFPLHQSKLRRCCQSTVYPTLYTWSLITRNSQELCPLASTTSESELLTVHSDHTVQTVHVLYCTCYMYPFVQYTVYMCYPWGCGVYDINPLCSSHLWFFLEPLVSKTDNFGFLQKMMDGIKETVCSDEPDNTEMNKVHSSLSHSLTPCPSLSLFLSLSLSLS